MESLDPLETLISEEEEEEEEDVDFNPLLKETPSREASSSLSSDVETLDAEPVNSITQTQDDGKEAKEGNAMESNAGSIPQVSKVPEEEEEDDAICKRTRARYSLESFTLDDLEAFLQETDDEDDIPNVDDEEEYRKFLAAVLHSADPEVHLSHNGDNNGDDDDDDDEDNDLDFEIELEEALETDDDEPIPEKVSTDNTKTKQKRPVTRQKRRQNVSFQDRIDSPTFILGRASQVRQLYLVGRLNTTYIPGRND